MTAKQPAKGGGRKPAASSNAGAALTPEQIAQIATQAAIAAVQQMANVIPAQQIEDRPGIKPSDLDNEGKSDAQELAEIRANEERHKRNAARAEELARELIPLIVRERHLPVFDWLRGNGTNADLMKEILSATLAKALTSFREANGQVSSSSRNLELLTDSLPAR